MPVTDLQNNHEAILAIKVCERCGGPFENTTGTGLATGYGMNGQDGVYYKLCYECCKNEAVDEMLTHGGTFLYLTKDDDGLYKITNWPGNLTFRPFLVQHGTSNIAYTRTDVWFVGPDDKVWWGVQQGDNSEIVRCKRTKQPKPQYPDRQTSSYTHARVAFDRRRASSLAYQQRAMEQRRKQAAAKEAR